MKLSLKQHEAVGMAANPESGRQVVTIAGQAGSGKSTLLRALTGELDAKGLEWQIFTPTHKATAVLRSKGIDPARIGTIKSGFFKPRFTAIYDLLVNVAGGKPLAERQMVLLAQQFDPVLLMSLSGQGMNALLHELGIDAFHPMLFMGWSGKDPDPDRIDIVIVDEASMVTADEVEQACRFARRVVLLGDNMQLPPVGDGVPAFDVYRPDIVLDAVFRQSDDSGVLLLARDVLNPEKNLYDLLRDADDGRYPGVKSKDAPIYDAISDAPILCWRNRTRIRTNVAFRIFHGHKPGELKAGDPVIGSDTFDRATRNRRFQWYPDNVLIPDDGGEPVGLNGTLIVCESRQVWRDAGLPEGDHVYGLIPGNCKSACFFTFGAAMTTHKSQGGEYPSVQISQTDLMALHASSTGGTLNGDGVAYWRRHLYTGITRARESVRLFREI